MWNTSKQPYRVTVVPCTDKVGCYRWVIESPDRTERSSYAFATAAGARASGESWRREFEAGKPMR